MNSSEKQYWRCVIGPINKNNIGWGADFPLRQTVKDKFQEMFPGKKFKCSSGWGLSEQMELRLSIISMLPQTNPNLLLKIDELLKDRTYEPNN